MFKRVFLTSLILAVNINIAFADLPGGARPEAQAAVSRVEAGGQPAPAAEATAETTTKAAPNAKTPKEKPYIFKTAPYIAFNVGPRINYDGPPAVYKGLEGTLSLGVEALLTTKIYLGAEVFYANSVQLKNYQAFGKNLKSTHNYGLDLRPGYLLTTYFLLYLPAGVVWTHFSGQESHTTAWRLGLGGETNLCKKWYIRAEYVFNYYDSIPLLGSIRTDQYNFGILYKFL